jgi:hypothetical protein
MCADLNDAVWAARSRDEKAKDFTHATAQFLTDSSESYLAQSLVELAGLGTLSPVIVQKLASDAVRDGLKQPELEWLSKMGSAGPLFV